METMTQTRETQALEAGNMEKALYLKWVLNALDSSVMVDQLDVIKGA